jgi:SAM-dependent methyltransferase
MSLFDLAAEYDSMLGEGLRLSGEGRLFFVQGRIRDLVQQLGSARPRRILDFGCGIGDTSAALAEALPGAEVLGVDNAERALAHAASHHADPRIRFEPLDAFRADASFDLCYVNGVFHHIRPEARAEALGRIRDALVPGGRLALFENNPWNPGTRLVMSRIPFDRDAVPLSAREARRLLETAGFRCARARFLFYFPRPLAFLRFLEPALVHIPLGAQYCVLAER